MAVKTRVRRRLKVSRRAKVRRSGTNNALAAKNDAKQQNQIDASVMIGGAHDASEKEADKMAAVALAGSESVSKESIGSSAPNGVQRACAECKEENEAKRDSNATPTVAPASRSTPASKTASQNIRSLGAGKPMSPTERAFFEPKFNQDFSSVRIHEGEKADMASKQIDARAFTYGTDIAFAKGEKQKGGDKMLAHELAHVAQNQDATTAHRQAAPAPAANCDACPNPVNPEVNVTITPIVSNGTPDGSDFGSTNWGSSAMSQLSVWHRERRTCNTCNTPEGDRPVWDLCPRKINALATVPIVIDRAEINRRDEATGRDQWTECGPNPGADSFDTEAGTGFTDPRQKTVAGVLHHERYHVGVSERLLRQRIQARNDIHQLCPYNAADIRTWKAALEATIRADAEAFLQGNPNEANEETNASNAECTQY